MKKYIFSCIQCLCFMSILYDIVALPTKSPTIESFTIHYLEDGHVITVTVELDPLRQIEHVSFEGGETLFDFSEGKVAYKCLNSSQCFIEDIIEETIEKDRMQLQQLKNGVVKGFYVPTLIIEKELNDTEVVKLFGFTLQQFCDGFRVSTVKREKFRKKRETPDRRGYRIHNSYGHHGHQSSNYAHYGHETYVTGNANNDGLIQNHVSHNEVSNVASSHSHPSSQSRPGLIPPSSESRFSVPGQYHSQYQTPSLQQTYDGNGRSFGNNRPRQFYFQNTQESGYQPTPSLDFKAGNQYRSTVLNVGNYNSEIFQPRTTGYTRYPQSTISENHSNVKQTGSSQKRLSFPAVSDSFYTPERAIQASLPHSQIDDRDNRTQYLEQRKGQVFRTGQTEQSSTRAQVENYFPVRYNGRRETGDFHSDSIQNSQITDIGSRRIISDARRQFGISNAQSRHTIPTDLKIPTDDIISSRLNPGVIETKNIGPNILFPYNLSNSQRHTHGQTLPIHSHGIYTSPSLHTSQVSQPAYQTHGNSLMNQQPIPEVQQMTDKPSNIHTNGYSSEIPGYYQQTRSSRYPLPNIPSKASPSEDFSSVPPGFPTLKTSHSPEQFIKGIEAVQHGAPYPGGIRQDYSRTRSYMPNITEFQIDHIKQSGHLPVPRPSDTHISQTNKNRATSPYTVREHNPETLLPGIFQRTYSKDSASSQTQIQTNGDRTIAEASAAGHYKGLGSQIQVQGGFVGDGSFSAQAQSGFAGGIVQSQVQGGKEGSLSDSSSHIEHIGVIQSQVQIGQPNNAVSSSAQGKFSGGITQVQTQSNKLGGSARAQAQSTGLSSSHVQINIAGKETNDQDRFQGTVSASVQGGPSTGHSETQLQGGYESGRTYAATAQSGFDNSIRFQKFEPEIHPSSIIPNQRIPTSFPTTDSNLTFIRPIALSKLVPKIDNSHTHAVKSTTSKVDENPTHRGAYSSGKQDFGSLSDFYERQNGITNEAVQNQRSQIPLIYSEKPIMYDNSKYLPDIAENSNQTIFTNSGITYESQGQRVNMEHVTKSSTMPVSNLRIIPNEMGFLLPRKQESNNKIHNFSSRDFGNVHPLTPISSLPSHPSDQTSIYTPDRVSSLKPFTTPKTSSSRYDSNKYRGSLPSYYPQQQKTFNQQPVKAQPSISGTPTRNILRPGERQYIGLQPQIHQPISSSAEHPRTISSPFVPIGVHVESAVTIQPDESPNVIQQPTMPEGLFPQTHQDSAQHNTQQSSSRSIYPTTTLPGVSEPDIKNNCCNAIRNSKRCCETSFRKASTQPISSLCCSKSDKDFNFSFDDDNDTLKNDEPCKIVKATCYIVYKPVGKARICKPTESSGC